VTGALARAVLSRYSGVAPEAFVMGTGSHGKPEVREPALPLAFNLANSDGLAVCAVAVAEQLGVDVEPVDMPGDALELAQTAFSADEIAALLATPAHQRCARIIAMLTVKEPYVKARGLGLA